MVCQNNYSQSAPCTVAAATYYTTLTAGVDGSLPSFGFNRTYTTGSVWYVSGVDQTTGKATNVVTVTVQ
jgi:hypothetical protein